MREVAHAKKQNPLSDLNTILQFGRYARRNHLCTFWWRLVNLFRGGGRSKFALLHWLWSSPLQHSRTTGRVCDVTATPSIRRGKGKQSAYYELLISRRSGMARDNEPYLPSTPQPQSVAALWLVLISRPAEDRRLSWPELLGEILRWFTSPKTVTHSSILSRRPGT